MENTNPKLVRKPPKATASRRLRKVLLIHGRDELNLLRLKEILSRFDLALVLLRDRPAHSHTIIEKFEQEAEAADFAIALMTPDDFVEFDGKRYHQARPNVHFEIGWAYCYFGRSRVCILVKKGTDLPSNLHGINRLDFTESVHEVAPQLVTEMASAGIIRYAARAS
jgi:predicted nucleotide-binding protein